MLSVPHTHTHKRLPMNGHPIISLVVNIVKDKTENTEDKTSSTQNKHTNGY
jgi:hypothetical protein